MSAPSKKSLVGVRIGRFRISREIGQGGMGTVYEAIQDAIGYRAAVKVLGGRLDNDPRQHQYVERFLDEARAVNLISHPGVVQIFDYGETDDHIVYIMMEYLEGQTLQSRLFDSSTGKTKRFSIRQALRLVRYVASAMAQAHDKGVLHRDLKPDNLVVIPDTGFLGGERIKILDFGLARFLDSPERRTTAGIALGTPTYMSPEQCLGEDLTGKTDVYSLGAILYEIFAGRPPFPGDQHAVVMRQHVGDAPQPLESLVPNLPVSVADLVSSMLQKQAGARPDMHKVVERIDSLEREGKLPAEEVTAAGAAKSPQPAGEANIATVAIGSIARKPAAAAGPLGARPTPPWIALLSVSGLLLGLAVGSLFLGKRSEPPPPVCPACPEVPPPAPAPASAGPAEPPAPPPQADGDVPEKAAPKGAKNKKGVRFPDRPRKGK